jgi:hypothetical protein
VKRNNAKWDRIGTVWKALLPRLPVRTDAPPFS